MPQILKPPYQGGGVFADFFRDRPEFAIELATTTHIWTMIEMDLADLLIFMQKGNAKTSMAVYFSIGSLEIRLGALQTVVKNTLPDDFYKQFLLLLKDIRKGAKKRNSVAHVRWAENGFFPDGIIKLPHSYEAFNNTGNAELWRVKDFKEINGYLTALRGRVSAFVHQVYQTHLKTPD